MENCIVVSVIELAKHPNATKLSIAKVSDGKNQTTVVCGAANIRLGIVTVLAPVGTIMPSGLVIKEAEIRGTKSSGMLCSAKDLGVAPEDGIVDLPLSTKIGSTANSLPLEDLSSVPWHEYKFIDAHFENKQTLKIEIARDHDSYQKLKASPLHKLLTQTFFTENQYRYRHFSP